MKSNIIRKKDKEQAENEKLFKDHMYFLQQRDKYRKIYDETQSPAPTQLEEE